jgi:ferrochelatase
MQAKIGVMLVNLGTPDDTSVTSVRRYLRQFLSDPRVIDIHAVARWLLLNLVILPTRPRKSAEAYQAIWSAEGSPLRVYGDRLSAEVQRTLGSRFDVRLAMRYQNPAIDKTLRDFHDAGINQIVVLPLFPQYAASSTGSALQEIYRVAGAMWNVPTIRVIEPFFEHPGVIGSMADIAHERLGDLSDIDHVLLSFHGLPERHVVKSDLGLGAHCLATSNCCDALGPQNKNCYRAQCFATARALVEKLGLAEDRYTVCFQSRLGRTPWIKPYTDEVIQTLAKSGVKRVAVLCPAFVADCLETVEEIGIRAVADFRSAGGESLTLVPSMNDHPQWVRTVGEMVHATAADWAPLGAASTQPA